MKNKLKKVIIGTAAAVIVFVSGGCMGNTITAATSNKLYREWGTNYFDKAVIDIHKEIIEVDVEEWTDYEASDAIIFVSKDVTIYFTHLRDCTLIGKK